KVVEEVGTVVKELGTEGKALKRDSVRSNRARTGLTAPRAASKDLTGTQVRTTTNNTAATEVSSLRTDDTATKAFEQKVLSQDFQDRALQQIAIETIQDGREVAANLGLNGQAIYSVGYEACLVGKEYSETSRANAIQVVSEMINEARVAVGNTVEKIKSVGTVGAQKLANLTNKSIQQGHCAIATLSKALKAMGSCEILNPVFYAPAQAQCAVN
ncbi:MAG: hypothetical protein KDD58_10925, partial [Bdellovibrionales bacterium]|nr:hypothetical protein [Bdellovibrionales bacterium]